jgi:hypothetical protein
LTKTVYLWLFYATMDGEKGGTVEKTGTTENGDCRDVFL